MSELLQGSHAWLNMRQTKIGASDAPAIMGVSPWTTPFQLWEQKLGLREVEMNGAMQRGLDLEEEARFAFEALKGTMVFPCVLFHPEIDFMIASMDGLCLEGKTAVEIKCPGQIDHATAKEGKIPEKYYPQLQHQLEVSGLDKIYYFSYTKDDERLIEVKRDQDYIDLMLEAEAEFYQRMIEKEAPQLCDRDHLKRDDEEWKYSALNYRIATKQRKILEENEDYWRKRLIELSGYRSTVGCGVKLTKYTRNGLIEYKHIPELIGVDLEQYRKPGTQAYRISETDDGNTIETIS